MLSVQERPLASTALPLRSMARAAVGVALAYAGSDRPAAAQTTDTKPLQLPPVSVQGSATEDPDSYQVKAPSLDKLTAPLVDTPQSMTEVPRAVLDDQGVTTIRDALRNVPGVSLAAGEGGQQGDNLSIRGFNAQNDFYLDGMRDFGSYYRDPFALETVEVLKGPASVLFGRGSTGGSINQVTRQAQLDPITGATLTLGTDDLYRFTVDVDRPIDVLAGSAFRIDVMGDMNGVAGRDDAESRRFGLAPKIAFGLGTDTRLLLDYYHLQSYDTPDYGIPWLNGSPAPVAQKNFYGYPTDDFLRTDVDIVTAKLEHDFSDGISVSNQFRYGNYDRALRVTESLIRNYGAGQDIVAPGIPLSSVLVSQHVIALQSQETNLDDQLDGTFRFATGPVSHTLIIGAEVTHQTSDPTRFTYPYGLTSLLNPVQPAAFALPATISSIASVTVDDDALYAIDTIALGEHWDLTGGWRWDRFESRYGQTVAPSVTVSRDDNLPTYRAAIVYKPTETGSIYADYGTSFDPSAEALSLSAATASVAPEKSTTYEVGTKWDVLDGHLSVTGALYQLEKSNAREVNPDDPTTDILAGDYRARGFEIGVSGHVTDRWELFAGYAYNYNIVVDSPNPKELGNQPPNSPRDTLSVWTSYHLPFHDIELGGGLNYVSSRTASSTPVTGTSVIERAPGYWTAQLMAKAPITENLSLQANVSNITDSYYYDELHPGHIILGPARAATLTLTMKY